MSEITSQNRRRANRLNAKKSTGPKTAKGKRNVRHNAVKHGLYSPDIIINSPHLKENAEEYDLLLASVMAELKPVGLLQECLARKIADCLWRLRRVIRAESAEHAIAKIKDRYGKVVVSVNQFRPEGRYQQYLWPI